MDIPEFLHILAGAAQSQGQEIYLVGGSVRDLLLKKTVTDYDILSSGDAIRLAREFEQIGICEIESLHPAFGTAKIKLAEAGQTLDLASPRRETYAYPGALPKVTYPVELSLDLQRRDFTINALAFRLGRKAESLYLDPFGGLRDLDLKLIRVLYPSSYYEDPTRIIRALRFARRFNFHIGTADMPLISQALRESQIIGLSGRVRGLRIGLELRRLLEGEEWLLAASQFREIGGWELCRANLNPKVNVCPPGRSLDDLELRLAWLLWDSPDQIALWEELGLSARKRKILQEIKKLEHSPKAVTLNFYTRIQALDMIYRDFLFSLNPSLEKLYQQMQKALPFETPASLLRRGISGKAIQDSLEEEFQRRWAEFS